MRQNCFIAVYKCTINLVLNIVLTVLVLPVSFMSNANAQTVSMDPNGGDAEMALEDGSLGHHEMTLTPREYEDPLSLPGGEHHISFAKFLEVKLLFSLKCVLRVFQGVL